ncbi:MAG TPA: glycosyltransferase family 2 protein [Cyclobacteriaceae bacterium]|nr:glycosyltransferase family 2 protein [Cyclobacteriaceae bacterium]
MKVSVIFSTYNMPLWLEKVLWGYECQTYQDFEIIIADDGSGPDTRTLIDDFKKSSRLNIIHVWQEDEGFQKSRILNKAILNSTTDYLIFTDGDCIPRNDFVQVHVTKARAGYFLSGGYFKLPMITSEMITRDDVIRQRAFDINWLYARGLEKTYKSMKLTSKGFKADFLNFITPATATWNGHNSSGWKEDLLSINGFNEDMKYGGQDRELGERLMNKGIKGIQVRYSAICIHLDHKREYKTKESVLFNLNVRKETRRSKKIWTENGLVKQKEALRTN